MRASRALLLTLAMTAALLGLLAALRGPSARLAAEHCRRQLADAPDQQVALVLRQALGLGEPGMGVVAEALGSPRESVGRAARSLLVEELDRWHVSRRRGDLAKQAVLVEALAERMADFGPTARRDAADLAGRILRWLPDADQPGRGRVIAACERVLKSVAERPGLLAQQSLAAAAMGQVGPGAEPGATGSASAPFPFLPEVADLARLPGGGLPIDPLPPSASGESQGERVADVRTIEPERIAEPSAARQLDGHDDAPGTGGASGTQHGTELGTRQPPHADRIHAMAFSEASDAEQPDPAHGMADVDAADLMRWLHADDRPAADGARAELARRGFTPFQLDLARRLFDPNPEVRKELVRALPGAPGVDAATWLLWLARDPDPEVRLAAIALVATTGDPALVERIERIARQDADPRIRRQAERLRE